MYFTPFSRPRLLLTEVQTASRDDRASSATFTRQRPIVWSPPFTFLCYTWSDLSKPWWIKKFHFCSSRIIKVEPPRTSTIDVHVSQKSFDLFTMITKYEIFVTWRRKLRLLMWVKLRVLSFQTSSSSWLSSGFCCWIKKSFMNLWRKQTLRWRVSSPCWPRWMFPEHVHHIWRI